MAKGMANAMRWPSILTLAPEDELLALAIRGGAEAPLNSTGPVM